MSQTTLSPELVSSYELEGYTNRLLSQREIAKMLDDHGNDYYVSEHISGKPLLAIDGEYCTDTTNWTYSLTYDDGKHQSIAGVGQSAIQEALMAIAKLEGYNKPQIIQAHP